jgi:hypothetical protein
MKNTRSAIMDSTDKLYNRTNTKEEMFSKVER